MLAAELEYELPEELIAQEPTAERDGARLLVLDRRTGAIEHASVRDLPAIVRPSLWVLNDTRVIPARLRGVKPTGGRVELLLLERLSPAGAEETWAAMGRASKGLGAGTRIAIAGGAIDATVEMRRADGPLVVRLSAPGGVAAALARVGEVPLPPYIRRAPVDADRERYQTVYASKPGAVAAPTAGLHLSRRLLDELATARHRLAYVTLHVGPGTFKPVEKERLEDHPMHGEPYDVPESTARAVADARASRTPVLAVGTTSVRVLESAAGESGALRVGAGETHLFLYPPAELRVVDALLTNFHLPRSTLLALVMAFGGIEPVGRAYREAVRARYRFFSYGDAMLVR